MKKLLTLCVICLGLSACAEDNAPDTQKQDATQATETVTTETTVEVASSTPVTEADTMAKPVADTATTNHHQGESLHDDKCTSCHKDDVYTREDRMVKTMSALEHQVDNCMRGAAKAEWTQPQTTSVIQFLNDRYYKF